MATETDIQHVAMTLQEQLPVLQIVIPFMTAPLIALIGSRVLAWWLAFAAALACLFISLALVNATIDGGYITYAIGGWAAPIGIEYRVDAANALVLFLISLIGTIVLPYAYESVKKEIEARHHALFYASYVLCFTGLLGMVVTGDAFNVFVFLEISSLSTYVLVALGAGRDKRALTAAYDYLIMGTLGATFFVIGIGFLYASTGTLNMADIADRIADEGTNRTVRAGLAFIVVGMGLKAAMVPLHLWLPKAYVFAPSVVTVFLSATATKASIYVMLRFIFSVYQPTADFEQNFLHLVFIPLAVASMFIGSFIAIFQGDFKRMLAWSSVGQIGYMLLGIAMINATGVAATLVHMFNHGITKALLFMAVGVVVLRVGSSYYSSLKGLGRSMPITAATVVIGGLSLIGVPGTAGFISKWMLVQAAFENGWWPVAVLIVLSSLLAVVYVWRAVEVFYMAEPEGPPRSDPPLTMLIPMVLLAIACIWYGIFTDLPLGASVSAAESLMNGSFGMTPAEHTFGGKGEAH